MKKLRELVEYIREELHDAKKYAKKAICYKEKDRELADMYISLSKQELEHADVETRSAQNVLSAAKKIGDEAYESMEQFWDWQHERMTDCEVEIKVLHDMYSKN